MNCPKCGAPIPEGVSYCDDPACGAVPGAGRPAAARVIKKYIAVKLNFDFVKLARLGAAAIILLAAAYLWFFAKPGR